MNFELIDGASIVASTNKNFDHSVGYHDIKPFNAENENLILLHRYPKNLINYNKKIKIDICLWDHKNDIMSELDETIAWSWEQGSRLQWLNKNELIYNISDNLEIKSCVYNIHSKHKKKLNYPIYSYSPETKKFLYINYSRLWVLWKSYGYFSNTSYNFENKSDEDGVFLSDLNNNNELILSIKDAVNLCDLNDLDTAFFIAHPTFSPNGEKFVSLLRFFNSSGSLISYLICTEIKSKKHRIISRERVSHFEWINNDKIVVWSRNINKNLQSFRTNKFLEKYFVSNVKKVLNLLSPNIKKNIISTHYHLIDVNNGNHKILDKKNLIEDGHPQISTDEKYLITDTYPNENNFQKLLLYNIHKDQTLELGKFKSSSHLKENQVKYDLHPRWSCSGKLISIDSSHEGSRQSYIINIEKILKKFS